MLWLSKDGGAGNGQEKGEEWKRLQRGGDDDDDDDNDDNDDDDYDDGDDDDDDDDNDDDDDDDDNDDNDDDDDYDDDDDDDDDDEEMDLILRIGFGHLDGDNDTSNVGEECRQPDHTLRIVIVMMMLMIDHGAIQWR